MTTSSQPSSTMTKTTAIETFPLFDKEQALKNCEEISIVKELITLLLEKQIPTECPRMQAAFAAKENDLIEEIAHKLKGGALYVGAIRMKEACQYLERYSKSEQSNSFETLYLQALKVIEDTRAYLSTWLSQDDE